MNGSHGSGRHWLGELVRAVDVIERQEQAACLCIRDQLARDIGRDLLPVLVERDVALGAVEGCTKRLLRQFQPVADCFEGRHGLNISRPDDSRQQSDCLRFISRTNRLRAMPAKELTPEQKKEAAALKERWRAWQRSQPAGVKTSQDEVSEKLGFGQSALSQYLNGYIPLNASAVAKFAALFKVAASDISPTVIEAARQQIANLSALSPGLVPPSSKGGGRNPYLAEDDAKAGLRKIKPKTAARKAPKSQGDN